MRHGYLWEAEPCVFGAFLLLLPCCDQSCKKPLQALPVQGVSIASQVGQCLQPAKAMLARLDSLIISSVQDWKLESSGTGSALHIAQQWLEALCFCLKCTLIYSRQCAGWRLYSTPIYYSRMLVMILQSFRCCSRLRPARRPGLCRHWWQAPSGGACWRTWGTNWRLHTACWTPPMWPASLWARQVRWRRACVGHCDCQQAIWRNNPYGAANGLPAYAKCISFLPYSMPGCMAVGGCPVRPCSPLRWVKRGPGLARVSSASLLFRSRLRDDLADGNTAGAGGPILLRPLLPVASRALLMCAASLCARQAPASSPLGCQQPAAMQTLCAPGQEMLTIPLISPSRLQQVWQAPLYSPQHGHAQCL